jgi:hypothetical protein
LEFLDGEGLATVVSSEGVAEVASFFDVNSGRGVSGETAKVMKDRPVDRPYSQTVDQLKQI